MNHYQPYTYLIGWTYHNKWYYGVRYSKKCNPTDLWKTYFTSSRHVKNFRKQHGEPDVIEIRKIFKNKEKAILWETKILKKLKVVDNDKWLNKHDSMAPPVYFGENHPNYGNKWTQEQKQKLSEKLKGKTKGLPKSNSHKIAISNGLKNQSIELRKKRSESSRGESNSNSKLTEKEVMELLQEYAERKILPDVGKISKNNRSISYIHLFSIKKSKELGVSLDTIKHILLRRTWKFLDIPSYTI